MPGGRRCSVAICKSFSTKAKSLGQSLTFHSFPKDKKLRKLWIQKCYRKDKMNPETAFICTLHFVRDDYEDAVKADIMNIAPKKLTPTAVPSQLLLPSKDMSLPKVRPTKFTKEKERKSFVEAVIDKSVSDSKEPQEHNPCCEDLKMDTIKCKSEPFDENDLFCKNIPNGIKTEIHEESIDPDKYDVSMSISNGTHYKQHILLPQDLQKNDKNGAEVELKLENSEQEQYFSETNIIKTEIVIKDEDALDMLERVPVERDLDESEVHKAKTKEELEPDDDANLKLNFMSQDEVEIKNDPGSREDEGLVWKEEEFIIEKVDDDLFMGSSIQNTELSIAQKGNFQCEICNKKFKRLENLKIHKRIHTGKKQFPCQFCQKSFTTKSAMIRHERGHTGEKPFSCKFCQKSFSRSCALRIHERAHTGEKPFSCKFCQKSFRRRSILQFHEMTHTGEKPFTCKFCQKPFTTKFSMRHHEMTHTGEKPFSCKICQKSFRFVNTLRRHELTHTDENPFSCKICQKPFTCSSSMKLHEITHAKEKPFLCQFCQKSFSRKNCLMNHEMTHTGEKPFKCKFCDKSFIRSTHRRIHEMSHADEKPFACKFCQKSFIRSNDLRYHEMTHTGEKPFSCKFCQKSFIRITNMRSHEIIHTEEKPFSCKFCHKSFSRLYCMRRHEKNHSNEKP